MIFFGCEKKFLSQTRDFLMIIIIVKKMMFHSQDNNKCLLPMIRIISQICNFARATLR